MSIQIGHRVFKCPSYVDFTFDDIYDPEFGTVTNLTGKIPFLCPASRLTTRSEALDSVSAELDTFTWNMVSKYRDAMGDSTDEEIYKCLNHGVRPVWVLLGPGLDHDPPRRNFIMEFITLCGPLDTDVDAMIGTNAFSTGIEGESDFNFTEIVEQFRGPSWPELDSLPSGLAALQKMVGVSKTLMVETGCGAMPHLKDQYGELLGPIVAAILYTHFLTHGMEWSKENGEGQPQKYSGLTMTEFWRDLGGWHMIICFLLIAHEVRLSEGVRKSKLLQISLDRAGDICILLNALAGLHRDVAMKQLDSPITYAVKVDGVSLQEAWDDALTKLHAAYADYRLTSQKLEQIYKSELPEIQRYNQIVNEYIDGCLYGYCTFERYGKCDQMKIIDCVEE